MNTYLNKIIILIIYFTSYSFVGFTQIEKKDSIEKIGGISINPEYQLSLEPAIFGIYYQTVYKVTNGKQEMSLCDTMLLAVGNTQSVFLDPTYKENLERDRIIRIDRSRKAKLIDIEHESIDNIIELVNPNSDYREDDPGEPVQIYKNRKSHLVTSIYNSYVNNIRCEQKLVEMLNWDILNDTDTILGYVTRKAQVHYAGRDYIAWFTEDIPINDGPWKFWGLPGLILKVADAQNLFQWIGIGIEKLNADIAMDKTKYENATLKQFQDFVNKETSKIIVSFYNNNVLYMTYKKRSFEKIPIELF